MQFEFLTCCAVFFVRMIFANDWSRHFREVIDIQKLQVILKHNQWIMLVTSHHTSPLWAFYKRYLVCFLWNAYSSGAGWEAVLLSGCDGWILFKSDGSRVHRLQLQMHLFPRTPIFLPSNMPAWDTSCYNIQKKPWNSEKKESWKTFPLICTKGLGYLVHPLQQFLSHFWSSLGGRELPYKRDRNAHRQIWIMPPKERKLGIAQPFSDPSFFFDQSGLQTWYDS